MIVVTPRLLVWHNYLAKISVLECTAAVVVPVFFVSNPIIFLEVLVLLQLKIEECMFNYVYNLMNIVIFV